MKKILLTIIIFVSFGKVNAQIADVKQRGSQLVVYGKNGLELSSTEIEGKVDIVAVFNSYFVVKLLNNGYGMGNYYTLETYDYKIRKIYYLYLGQQNDAIIGKTKNYFTVKRKGTVFTYNEDCKEINGRKDE
jgi:hypothetical protein